MGKREKRLISIDSALAKLIDEDIKKIGKGCNFSAYMADLAQKNLRNAYGLRYNYLIKKYENELAQ